MTDEQRAALEWLDEAGTGHETFETNLRHRATIKSMLDRPAPNMPKRSAIEEALSATESLWTGDSYVKVRYEHLFTLRSHAEESGAEIDRLRAALRRASDSFKRIIAITGASIKEPT